MSGVDDENANPVECTVCGVLLDEAFAVDAGDFHGDGNLILTTDSAALAFRPASVSA